MPHELRTRGRVPVSMEVVCEAASGKHSARISDIDASGCYIDSIAQVAVGEIVTFKTRLPTGHWVQLRGEVVSQEWHAGYDLRFKDLTDEEEALLAEVIKAKSGEPASRPSIKSDRGGELPMRGQNLGRVLVAEDDPVCMRLVAAVVEKEGYTVVPAWDGREACRLLQHDADFAAALFDMMMPHLQGLDLIRHMRTEKRLMRIPVGIVTAEQDPKLWDDSIAAGAGIFLPKPFSPNQLQYMLRVLLSKGR
jgi:CheY-like chemotaxis protein